MGDGSVRDVKGKGRALPDNDMLALDLDAAEGGFGGQAQQMQLVEQQVRHCIHFAMFSGLKTCCLHRIHTSSRVPQPSNR